MKNIFLILFTFFFLATNAQQTPAPPQSQGLMIVGATAHLGNGEVIESSIIIFEDGKITQVSDSRGLKAESNMNYQLINAEGKHVYPGFIAPNTQLGLIEINAVRSTRDSREVGLMNPNIRSIIAYNTDSKVSPTIRSNGTLLAQVVPEGGRISGQSSLVQLDAWNWEDAAYKTDDGIHLRWPREYRWTWRTRMVSKNKDYEEQVTELETYLEEAAAYNKMAKVSKTNLKFEAMKGLFDGSKKLYVHIQTAKAMTRLILMCKSIGITPVIIGGREAWMITDLLKENNISILLNQVQSLPSRDDEDIDQPFKTAKILHEKGILFGFSMEGGWEQRNLPFQAGHAVGFGLPYEAAVVGLTLNTAKIIGVDKTLGSLETGKDATLFIAQGDALDMRTCKIERAFINGREIDLNNKQKELAKKFRAKYGK